MVEHAKRQTWAQPNLLDAQATPHGVDEMRNTNTLTYGSVPLP